MAETLIAYDYLEPGIYPGKYEFALDQRVRHSGKPPAGLAQEPLKLDPSQKQVVTLGVPAFALPSSDEVRGCYPPPGSDSDCARQLPYVLLQRRALPWERKLGDGGRTPWLALLTLTEGELATGAALSTGKGAAMLAPATPAKPAALLYPALTGVTEADRAADLAMLDIDTALFQTLAPRLAELPALAHIRQVPLAAKPGPDQGSAEFALLLGNRFAQPGANIALLVSLEGHAERLAGAPVEPGKRVRLAVLHQWRFTCTASGTGSFESRVAALRTGPLAVPADSGWDSGLRELLAQGIVPIAHESAGRERKAALYRGPLVPVRPSPVDLASPALLDAPDPGARDMSMAAAWQLGRMLALSSSDYAHAVLRAVNRRTAGRLGGGRGDLADTSVPALLATLTAILKGQIDRKDSPPPEALDALAIGSWLVRLSLLGPVPLRYLVPSGRMLPPESIRSFHLDDGWTFDALLGGALSLGSELAAPGSAAPTRETLRTAVRALFEAVRAWTLGSVQAAAIPVAAPVHGLMLRSRLLRDYPGLELTVQGHGKVLKPLRLELVGDDVLILMVQGPVTGLSLREPREGLKFRCGDKQMLLGRDGAPALALGPLMRPGAAGVLDVARLADAIGCGTERSGAKFANRWMNRPSDFQLAWSYSG